jgi:outer membrane immunogenic protein
MKTRVAALAISAFALISLPVNAADMARKMPVKAPPPPPAPIYTWTGCYLGIAGGGVWGKDTRIATTQNVGTVLVNFSPDGGIFGGTIGCNYQANSIVIGIESDFSWDGLRGSAHLLPPNNVLAFRGVSTTWLDTVRGRVGIVAGPALFYATGGVAFTRIDFTAANPIGLNASTAQNVSGWTAGGGIEYMFAPRWSAKIEYLYVRFREVHDGLDIPVGGFFAGGNDRLTENIVRAGINYRFWGF